MYFGKMTRAIREAYLRQAFELPPPTPTVQFAQTRSNPDRTTESDWLDLPNLTDNGEPH